MEKFIHTPTMSSTLPAWGSWEVMMEEYATICYAALLLLAFLVLLSGVLRRPGKNYPPSPPAIPLLGHLHLLKKPVHHSLAAVSARYGPITALRFGSRRVLLVSSAAAAQECFSKNDIIFANRPRLLAGKMLGYDYTVMGWASYGPHWRNLRRIATLELFSTHRLQSLVGVREEEVDAMARDLALLPPHPSHKVTLRPRLFRLALNIMMRTLCGKRYYGEDVGDEEEANRLEEIIKESLKLSSASNIGDFLPLLRVVGPAGLKKQLATLLEKRDSFTQSLLDEHRSRRRSDEPELEKTVIGVLVKLQEEDPTYYTDEIIKGNLMGLLTAGTDTSISTTEWAMAELVSQPELLAKAREELDSILGFERTMKEKDLSSLPFLGMIIEETLRLHPAASIIPAHESSDECRVGGFDVGKGTMLLVNSWAIHRDKDVWEESDRFLPERFEGVSMRPETMMPFGLGRRRCPGEGLAVRLVGLLLGTLLHSFEWVAGEEGEVDLSEGAGLTTPMANPLEVMCKPRPFMAHLLASSCSI